MRFAKKILFITAGYICLALGFIGMFVPVLPTTPLVLLAAFLFSRSSERLSSWIATTPIYRAYVEPFKQSGGISLPRKMRILAISYSVMGAQRISGSKARCVGCASCCCGFPGGFNVGCYSHHF